MRQRNLNSQKKPQTQTQNYGSTYTVECQQKDLIISKLKAQAQGLKKNEQQYTKLRQQYQIMERKYRSLQQQKGGQDRDFKSRHQSCLKHICQLKNQTQALRCQLRDKKLQIGDMETDANTLRNNIDQRNIQLDKYRAQLNGLFADTQQLQGERAAFIRQLDDIRRNNDKLKQQADSLDSEEVKTRNRTMEMEKYLEQLEIEGKLLKDKITHFEDNNNGLDSQINEVVQDTAEIQNQIYEAHSQINGLQSAIAQLTADSQKYRSQAIHNQKGTQNEAMKNNDFVKQIKQAQHMLGVRINQSEQGRKEITSLCEQNDNLQKINDQLQQDMESCRRHLQNLGLLNNQLIQNLQRFSDQDESVRNLINRKDKVSYMKGRVTQTSSTLGNFGKLSSRTESTLTGTRRSYGHY